MRRVCARATVHITSLSIQTIQMEVLAHDLQRALCIAAAPLPAADAAAAGADDDAPRGERDGEGDSRIAAERLAVRAARAAWFDARQAWRDARDELADAREAWAAELEERRTELRDASRAKREAWFHFNNAQHAARAAQRALALPPLLAAMRRVGALTATRLRGRRRRPTRP